MPPERQSEPPSEPLSARPSEQLLVDSVPAMLERGPVRQVLCASLGRGQLARRIAALQPAARVTCNYLDLYQARSAAQPADPATLRFTCAPDAPVEAASCELAALPCSTHGDAELTRDLLQSAHDALLEGGQLWTSTDNPRDRWLREELDKLFPRIKTRASDTGVVYSAIKTGPLKKHRDFSCWFAFRDGPRLLRVVTRPGVFSHRHLDTGARALLETMAPRAGARVLDLGCGAGVVSFAAAARAAGIQVLSLDSNPRAVACTALGAQTNDLPLVTAVLDADATCDAPGAYDLVVANPPYYSHQRITGLFVDGAWNALRRGGELLIVTKDVEWYLDNLPIRFDDVEVLAVRAYFVARARKR